MRAGLKSTGARGTGMMVERLTSRDRDVLCLVAQGLTNFQIARSLCIEEQTVANRIRRLMHMTGLSSRVLLAIYAIKARIITLDEIEL
jgi:DNA-binding NarL/FixJ family response regulator